MIYFLGGSGDICRQWCRLNGLRFGKDVHYITDIHLLYGLDPRQDEVVLGYSWWTKNWADHAQSFLLAKPGLKITYSDGHYGQEFRQRKQIEKEEQEALQSETYQSRFELMEFDIPCDIGQTEKQEGDRDERQN